MVKTFIILYNYESHGGMDGGHVCVRRTGVIDKGDESKIQCECWLTS